MSAGWAGPVRAAECSKVIITGHSAYPPTTWYDGKHMQGGWHLVAARVFEDLGVPYEVSYQGPWARVLELAKIGKIDLVATLKENPDRRQYLTFSTVGGTPAPITVFVRRGAEFAYAGRNDLLGKRGGRVRGEGYGSETDAFVKDRLYTEEVQDFQTNLKKLEMGRIDYAISGYYPGTARLAVLRLEDRFMPLQPNLSEDLNHFAFASASPCVKHLPAFDRRLAELLKDGTVARLLNQGSAYWRANPDPGLVY